MTGKELIRYIIDNDLEQEQVFQNGKFIGFITREEAAQKFHVGVATSCLWGLAFMVMTLKHDGEEEKESKDEERYF